MKLFQQEQQQAVTSLKEQTSKIGSDAANLTKALKGDSKLQGDWGEMVLETILETVVCARMRSSSSKRTPRMRMARTSVRMSSSDSLRAEAW